MPLKAATDLSTPAGWRPSPAAPPARSCAPSPSWRQPPPSQAHGDTPGRKSSGTEPPGERYAAIRRDADNGLSRRAIISSQQVGRRTVALALTSAEPPERKKIHREPAALHGLHARIDAMIDEDPTIGTAAIWQRLADDHGTTVAYYTLRAYVVSRRAAKPVDKNN